MRLYLSSYNFGDHPERMFALLKGEKGKVAIITNAADAFPEEGVVSRFNEQAEFFRNNGYEVERLDLKNYFENHDALAKKSKEFKLFWVRGGNVFVLRMAMKLSGFDSLIVEGLREDKFVYAGYSAGGCVLCPDLNSFDIVDDAELVKGVYGLDADYSALGVLDYYFEPHYKSDHPESADIDEEIAVLEKKSLSYKAIHDGQAIIVDGDQEVVL